MDPDSILRETEERMLKAIDHLKSEYRGIRTGRASTALVEYLKVDYYGSATDLKSLASISTPESTQILIKPFDAGCVSDVKKAIETSDLGLTPMVDNKQIRINIPPLSTDRRKQLVSHCRKAGEEVKVSMRNVRRDSNKHVDQLKTNAGKSYSEDEIETLKNEIQELLKKYEARADELIREKSEEVMTV